MGEIPELRALREAADRARSIGVEGLTLAEVGSAMESVANVLDGVWGLVGSLGGRVEEIRTREFLERRDGPGLEAVDSVYAHLAYGRDAVGVAAHVVGQGRGELLALERE